MAQPRKPVDHLKLIGGYRSDRHGTREFVPAPEGELGPPPPHLIGRGEREAWAELAAAGASWLTDADRLIVEMTARLLAMCQSDPAPQAAIFAQTQQALARLGMTPADRRRVLVRQPEPAVEQSTLARLAAKRGREGAS